MSNIMKPISDEEIAERLWQLMRAVTTGDMSEFTMRVPADPKRDADLMLAEASRRLKAMGAMRAALVEITGMNGPNTAGSARKVAREALAEAEAKE